MPPKAKIHRQMILDAAFSIAREQGHDMINARSIAKALDCSTQPILYHFKTIEEIRQETYRQADEFHSRYIAPTGKGHPLLELGLNYIRFGHEEKHLFRFLFQTNSLSGFTLDALLNNPELEEMLRMIASGMDCSPQRAREIFLTLFAAAHGLASLLANNAMAYDEDALRRILESTFRSAVTPPTP